MVTHQDPTDDVGFLIIAHGGREVVGVIGGLHQDGCEPWTSSSARFGPALLSLYKLAQSSGAPRTVLPHAGSDGCSSGL